MLKFIALMLSGSFAIGACGSSEVDTKHAEICTSSVHRENAARSALREADTALFSAQETVKELSQEAAQARDSREAMAASQDKDWEQGVVEKEKALAEARKSVAPARVAVERRRGELVAAEAFHAAFCQDGSIWSQGYELFGDNMYEGGLLKWRRYRNDVWETVQATIRFGEFNHVVATYDGTFACLFVDGQQQICDDALLDLKAFLLQVMVRVSQRGTNSLGRSTSWRFTAKHSLRTAFRPATTPRND